MHRTLDDKKGEKNSSYANEIMSELTKYLTMRYNLRFTAIKHTIHNSAPPLLDSAHSRVKGNKVSNSYQEPDSQIVQRPDTSTVVTQHSAPPLHDLSAPRPPAVPDTQHKVQDDHIQVSLQQDS